MQKDKETVLLAKGVDTLYLHLRPCGIDWKPIFERGDMTEIDEALTINGLQFVRKKQWIGRHYPLCLQHAQFRFFINRQSAYIKASSLAFEMRGYEGVVQWLCRILDRLHGGPQTEAWLEFLRVSRIDVYADFVYDGDFKIEQFSTRLRSSGLFQSGKEAEGKTLYFGNRKFHDLFVRLYVKSVEIKESGKTYLQSSWRESGHDGSARVWRLEFEYHKKKIEEICQYRELIAVDVNALDMLWSYGVSAIKYVKAWVGNGNLSKQPLHPVWQCLHDALFKEYAVKKKEYKRATAAWWYRRIRNSVILWLASQDYAYEDLPAQYIRDFSITEVDYEKARNRQPFAFRDWEPEFWHNEQMEIEK
jgi:hypothetical protein